MSAAEHSLPASGNTMIGPFREGGAPDDDPLHRTLQRQLKRAGMGTGARPTDEQWRRLLTVISGSYDEADNDRYMLERSIEVSSFEMRGLYDELVSQAHTDALTGLPNRTDLLDRLDRSLGRAESAGDIALLFIDLDGFKLVNDTFGHPFGDELLVQVAQRIRSKVRGTDDVARLGGDEFVVVCRDQNNPATALMVADRLVSTLNQPFQIGTETVHISASIGLADAEAGLASADLMRRADMAMYSAKERGRATYVSFDSGMEDRAQDRVAIEKDLRHAIENRDLFVYLQPVISLTTGEPTAAEALVRWNRPGHGFTGPDKFIPIAEQSRLIHDVTAEVLRLACTAAARWQSPLPICVNLSARDLHHAGLETMVRTAADASGIDPSRLVVEVTESSLLLDSPELILNLAKLRALGIDIAVDDFGKEYSSLSYLRRLPASSLKVDRTFVNDIDSDPTASAIVRAIVELGHALGLNVIAEGVERSEQANELRRLGCDQAQGYFFARPGLNETLADFAPRHFGPRDTTHK
jgi:diguanylate cyclase